MATWMTHFRIADKFIDIIGIDKMDLPCFVFGNIAPDCGIPNSDGTYTPDKDTTHFGHTDNRNYKQFCDTYFVQTRNVCSDSFYLGYYLHLLTDAEWVYRICRPTIKQFQTEFPDRNQLNLAIKQDWGSLDQLFYQRNPHFRAFQIFDTIKNFPNDYLPFFPQMAFDWQLSRIRDFYHASPTILEREYRFLSEKEIDDFITEAVDSMKIKMAGIAGIIERNKRKRVIKCN